MQKIISFRPARGNFLHTLILSARIFSSALSFCTIQRERYIFEKSIKSNEKFKTFGIYLSKDVKKLKT
jgi:hypothetical protein